MEYKDFGEWLYELRNKNDYTENELVQKIDIGHIKEINIKRWERDLEFPNLDVMYKLSEIYKIPIEELLNSKEMTLKSGIDGIPKRTIRIISLLLGISIYGTIILFRIILTVILVVVFIWFCSLGNI